MAKASVDTCTVLEVMGTMGGYQGHGAPLRGLGGALLTPQGQKGLGSLTRSPGGPLHHGLRLRDGHLRDAAASFHRPRAEASWRTGCLRGKNRKKAQQSSITGVLQGKMETLSNGNPRRQPPPFSCPCRPRREESVCSIASQAESKPNQL